MNGARLADEWGAAVEDAAGVGCLIVGQMADGSRFRAQWARDGRQHVKG